MIQITDRIWIGSAYDEKNLLDIDSGVTGVLNVAFDLRSICSEANTEIECMHIGLVDGPGNTIGSYCAAVLGLATLLDRHEQVMVVCHGGRTRSLAVVIMYMILKEGRKSEPSSTPARWRSWFSMLAEIRCRVGEQPLPDPPAAHMEASNAMPYGLLECMI